MKFLLVILVSAWITSCSKEEKCPVEIRIPYWVSPVKNEYRVGDTIEISSKFASKLRDKNGNLFNFENNEWINNFVIITFSKIAGKYKNTSLYLEIIDNSQYELHHAISDTDDSYYGVYKRDGDSLEFVIKGVLIKPGIIRTGSGVGTAAPVEASRSYREGWVYNPPFEILMNDGINYNLELLDEIDTSGNNYIRNNPDKFNKEGGYLMKIVP